MAFLRRAWAEIHADALASNIISVRRCVGESVKIMAVVKADGYGHGDCAAARIFETHGADWFAVSNIQEALHLRQGGITKPILILGYTPPDQALTLYKESITQTVFSLEYAKELSSEAQKQNVTLDCHIKLDTGMSRLGFVCEEGCLDLSVSEISAATMLPGLKCDGVFTHFACADELTEEADRFTFLQFQRFLSAIDMLQKRGIAFSLRHCANSAATMRFPEMRMDMVRPGIILYGHSPSKECEGILRLFPAMELKTTVAMVKKLRGASPVSYGRTYCAAAGTTLATVPIGYADGYRRSHSNSGFMLVRGKRAPVVGTVCMDQLMLDVSEIEGVSSEDEVTVFGRDGENEITVEEIASAEGSIPYEVLCLVGKRVPRVFVP